MFLGEGALGTRQDPGGVSSGRKALELERWAKQHRDAFHGRVGVGKQSTRAVWGWSCRRPALLGAPWGRGAWPTQPGTVSKEPRQKAEWPGQQRQGPEVAAGSVPDRGRASWRREEEEGGDGDTATPEPKRAAPEPGESTGGTRLPGRHVGRGQRRRPAPRADNRPSLPAGGGGEVNTAREPSTHRTRGRSRPKASWRLKTLWFAFREAAERRDGTSVIPACQAAHQISRAKAPKIVTDPQYHRLSPTLAIRV